MARALAAIFVFGAFARRAMAIETKATGSAIGIPIAFLLALPGTAVEIARARDEEADAAHAAAVVVGAGGVVGAETAAAQPAFSIAAYAFDAGCAPPTIAVARATSCFALAVDAGLSGRAGIGRVAPLLAWRFGWLTARVGTGDVDGEQAGVKPLRVG